MKRYCYYSTIYTKHVSIHTNVVHLQIVHCRCEIQELFSGEYETKVAVIALTKFLPLFLASDSPLASIMVSDDEMALEGGRITRSSKQQQEPAMVPITVKIFKILVQEFSEYTISVTRLVHKT